MRGYFYWSFIDNFEWAEGTRARFGLVYIDYATQRRVAKTSAAFFARLAQTNSFSLTPSECNATTSVTSRFQAEAAELTKLMSELNGTSPSGPNGTPSNGSAGAGAPPCAGSFRSHLRSLRAARARSAALYVWAAPRRAVFAVCGRMLSKVDHRAAAARRPGF